MTRIARQLAAAIQTMRDACDQAERTATLADARAVRRVLHELTWGLANASSSIESALNALEGEQEIASFADLKDATRYRHIRDSPWSPALDDVIAHHRNKRWDVEIDASIVASMASASA